MIKADIDVLKDDLLERFFDMTCDFINSLEDIDENNCIKDVKNFKYELMKDGLFSEELDNFIDNYMSYKN